MSDDCAEDDRGALCGRIADLVAELARVKAELDEAKAKAPRMPFDVRCADALADEVNVLVRRGVIDMRSPAADALLSYRDPPHTPRSDRMAQVEKERDEAVAARDGMGELHDLAMKAKERAESERNEARAVAFEESARYWGLHKIAESTEQQFADDLRRLAPLPASLVCVERETVEAMKRFDADHGANDCNCEVHRAALALLGRKP